MKILRATVLSNSKDDSKRRVKINVPGIWEENNRETQLVDSINGIYLEKGEIVWVWMSDSYDQAVILGRCEHWLEAEELVSIINTLVDAINKLGQKVDSNAQTFNMHSHGGVYTGGATTLPAQMSGSLIQTDYKPLDKYVVHDNQNSIIHK